jgi:hypothetical protein
LTGRYAAVSAVASSNSSASRPVAVAASATTTTPTVEPGCVVVVGQPDPGDVQECRDIGWSDVAAAGRVLDLLEGAGLFARAEPDPHYGDHRRVAVTVADRQQDAVQRRARCPLEERLDLAGCRGDAVELTLRGVLDPPGELLESQPAPGLGGTAALGRPARLGPTCPQVAARKRVDDVTRAIAR